MLQDILDGLVHTVEIGHLVEEPNHAPFGTRAVVADDVEDQRVVELASLSHGVDQPADLRVRVLAEPGEHLHLAGEELLLIRGQRGPVLDGRRLWRKLRLRRYHAQPLLPCQRLFAHRIPALVELALVLGDPFLRHVVRGVGGAGREVDEEGFVRRERFLIPHPVNGLVGHVGHKMVVRVRRWLDLHHPVVDQWRPLVGLAADEAVELIEARTGRPAVGRAGGADLPGRGLVRFAEGGGAVAVQPQHLRQRRHAVGALTGLPGEGGGGLRD